MQADLFTHSRINAEAGKLARDAGIARVSISNESWIEKARSVARKHCQVCGNVSANNIRHYVDHGFLEEPAHRNAYGAIFRSKEFVFTGRYLHSDHVSRHAGLVRIWELA